MKKIIESLFELQNLHLQSKRELVADRELRIGTLRKKIPAQLLVNFDRSQIRGKKSVSVVRNSVCTECHLQIPIGVVTALASGDEIQRCGNCGRYLYLPEGATVTPPPAVPAKPVKARRKKEARELAHAS
jgi:predicted  nucleic acid-binding Zn-ribbon protein